MFLDRKKVMSKWCVNRVVSRREIQQKTNDFRIFMRGGRRPTLDTIYRTLIDNL